MVHVKTTKAARCITIEHKTAVTPAPRKFGLAGLRPKDFGSNQGLGWDWSVFDGTIYRQHIYAVYMRWPVHSFVLHINPQFRPPGSATCFARFGKLAIGACDKQMRS